jgi:hypothetical protein
LTTEYSMPSWNLTGTSSIFVIFDTVTPTGTFHSLPDEALWSQLSGGPRPSPQPMVRGRDHFGVRCRH